MIARRAAIALLWLASAPAALAQADAAKTRLDEFALPAASASTVRVDQVAGSRDASTVPDTTRGADRTDPARPPAQLGPVAERQLPQQVGKDQQRDAAPPANLSRRDEGRPGAVVTLGGADRCDPQQEETSRDARCRRILERRAAEFAAPAAPRVSAEAALLALDRSTTSLANAATMDRRVRAPGQAVDAEDQANQELAAIAIATAAPPSPGPEPEQDAEASLNQALADIVVQLQGLGTPP